MQERATVSRACHEESLLRAVNSSVAIMYFGDFLIVYQVSRVNDDSVLAKFSISLGFVQMKM